MERHAFIHPITDSGSSSLVDSYRSGQSHKRKRRGTKLKFAVCFRCLPVKGVFLQVEPLARSYHSQEILISETNLVLSCVTRIRTASGKHKFQAGYSQNTWNRNTTLSRSFTFLGETYVANLATSSDLKLSDFRAMYAYRWGNEKIRIGPMLDMGVITTRLNISGSTNNGARSGSGSISKFAATVGYDLDYDPTPKVNIFNNLGAIAFQGDRVFHFEGGIRVFPVRHFGFSGGYKVERTKLENEQDSLKVIAHGPFFGGVLRF